MKILKTNIENLEENTLMLYKLTKGKTNKSANKLDDEELEREYPVTAYLLYEDENNKGETVKLLSILSGNEVITAQSATVQKSFFEIIDLVKGRDFSIKFTDGKTKSDRRFMDCDLADVVD